MRRSASSGVKPPILLPAYNTRHQGAASTSGASHSRVAPACSRSPARACSPYSARKVRRCLVSRRRGRSAALISIGSWRAPRRGRSARPRCIRQRLRMPRSAHRQKHIYRRTTWPVHARRHRGSRRRSASHQEYRPRCHESPPHWPGTHAAAPGSSLQGPPDRHILARSPKAPPPSLVLRERPVPDHPASGSGPVHWCRLDTSNSEGVSAPFHPSSHAAPAVRWRAISVCIDGTIPHCYTVLRLANPAMRPS